MTVCPKPLTSLSPYPLTVFCVGVMVGFVNDSTVRVEEGEVVRLCGQLANVAPALLQRDIVLEGSTTPGTAEGILWSTLYCQREMMGTYVCAEGSDYEAVSWNFTFSSSSGLACVEVSIRDDSTPELVETFNVTLQPIGPSRLISVQPSEISIHISNDDGTTVAAGVYCFIVLCQQHFPSLYPSVPQLVVEIVGSPSDTTTIILEDGGKLNKLIRVSSSGEHPFPLDYQVSVTPSSKPLIHYAVCRIVYSLPLH